MKYTSTPATAEMLSTPKTSSALDSLWAIARANLGRLSMTFGLVALENGLLLAYPLFAAFAINAIIAGDTLAASSYALIVLGFWVVGALRRGIDTRTFTRIYAGLAVKVAMDQRSQQQDLSTSAARVVLAREFVDFFEKQMPMIATSIASMFGAVAMLLVIEPITGIASCIALSVCLLFLPRFAARNEVLHGRLNNRLEREIGLIEDKGQGTLARHYIVLSRLRIWLSDREALAYIVIGFVAALLFGFAIYRLAGSDTIEAGHIYAVMTYLWTFVNSLDEAPSLVDQFARLKDIGRRVAAAPDTAAREQ